MLITLKTIGAEGCFILNPERNARSMIGGSFGFVLRAWTWI
jgi:hypothetical protein